MKKIFRDILFTLALFFHSTILFAQTGSISGTVVTDAAENISEGLVNVVQSSNPASFVAQGSIVNGVYTLNNIPDGSYSVSAISASIGNDKYIPEIFNNLQCGVPPCPFDQATPVVISGGNAVSGINFVLSKGAKIKGRVSDSNNALTGSSLVYLLNSAKSPVGTFNGNNSFDYEFGALPAGTYYVGVNNSAGFGSELYDNIVCVGQTCLTLTGTPITVTAAQEVSNINFTLSLGGTISGNITDAISGAPITPALLYLYDSSNALLKIINNNQDGTFAFADGFPTGSYFVTVGADNYIAELYNNISCPDFSCSIAGATPINVTVGQNTVANFALSAFDTATLPDLTGKLSGIPATKKVKRPTLTIKNSSALGTTSFSVKFYRSETKKLTNKSKLFKTQTVPSLAAKSETKITFALKSDTKRPYLIVDIDPEQAVGEKSETNNKLTKKL